MSGNKRLNGAPLLETPVRILGIDPGLQGGWAVISQTGELLYCGCMPVTTHPAAPDKRIIDAAALAQTITMAQPTIAFIEAVHSRPRQAGAFAFGLGVGVVLGSLSICGVPCRQVSPAAWKSTYGLRMSAALSPPPDDPGAQAKAYKAMKDEARRVASSLFPDWAEAFAKVKDDGVAEAALIALHGLATNKLTTLAAAV